ncbi:MAG TPA: glycosyltransferase family 1 protein [Acidimicrobiales bacterium]|nr:glycosyltransferase family 1 protein [Acidimicrobiales bacterium]
MTTRTVVTYDARHVGLPGVGRFVTGLWPALQRAAGGSGVELVALTPGRARGWLGPSALTAPAGTRLRSAPLGLLEHAELPRAIKKAGAAVHHATHLGVPLRPPVPVVLTVHDVFPLLEPDHARSAAAAAYYRAVMPEAIRRASLVVAVSELTACDLADRLGVTADAVIEHGIDHSLWHRRTEDEVASARRAFGLRAPYLLYVGTAKAHKNLGTVLGAHHVGLPTLVLAGPTAAEVARAAARLPPGVRVLGRVEDGLLPALYSGAVAVLAPSDYEAVGLTALEAMACGTPVVASTGRGMAATVGDAALMVATRDRRAWAWAMTRVTEDDMLRADLVRRGERVVAGRSWDEAAGRYVELYLKAAGR